MAALTATAIALLLLSDPVAAEATRHEGAGAFAVLQVLIETAGVSGHEGPVREAILTLLPDWARKTARVDPKGNLLLTFGQAGKELLFIAHMDETGYEITSLERDGTARVRSRGGFFNTLSEAHAVSVRTREGEVGAIIRPREGYLSAPGGGPDLTDERIVVDFGTDARRETEALGVSPGDPLTVPKRFQRLAGGMGSGRAVDDRAGCTALILAARRMDPARVKNRVTFAWSVEEELGLNGAAALAKSLHPDIVFAVDTFVSSDSPLERKGFALGVLGKGPVIRAIDNSNLAPQPLVRRVADLAASRGIPIQVGLTRGGNDGSVFPPEGTPDVPISWPTIYSHSPVEVVHEADLENLGRLVETLGVSW